MAVDRKGKGKAVSTESLNDNYTLAIPADMKDQGRATSTGRPRNYATSASSSSKRKRSATLTEPPNGHTTFDSSPSRKRKPGATPAEIQPDNNTTESTSHEKSKQRATLNTSNVSQTTDRSADWRSSQSKSASQSGTSPSSISTDEATITPEYSPSDIVRASDPTLHTVCVARENLVWGKDLGMHTQITEVGEAHEGKAEGDAQGLISSLTPDLARSNPSSPGYAKPGNGTEQGVQEEYQGGCSNLVGQRQNRGEVAGDEEESLRGPIIDPVWLHPRSPGYVSPRTRRERGDEGGYLEDHPNITGKHQKETAREESGQEVEIVAKNELGSKSQGAEDSGTQDDVGTWIEEM
ncbi:unnamed protein product [Diplocarpon coronariae]